MMNESGMHVVFNDCESSVRCLLDAGRVGQLLVHDDPNSIVFLEIPERGNPREAISGHCRKKTEEGLLKELVEAN